MKNSDTKGYTCGGKRYAHVLPFRRPIGRGASKPMKEAFSTDVLMHGSELNNLLIIRKEHKISFLYKLIKRLIDIVFSLVVILFTWPIMVYIWRYIKKASPDPAIFKQTRIKKNRRNTSTPSYYLDPKSKKFLKNRRKSQTPFAPAGGDRRKANSQELYFFCPKHKKLRPDRRKKDLAGQPFVFYKFRTMFVDAKERFPELYAYKYNQEEIKHLKFKMDNDPRVPEWARWLRRSSLDELPNIINVLLGDVSLVGPRPDIPEMIQYYSDEQRIKLDVKPGITGLTQIEGRGHLTFQATLKYDVEYVKNCSLLFDMKILAKTIRAVWDGNGAY